MHTCTKGTRPISTTESFSQFSSIAVRMRRVCRCVSIQSSELAAAPTDTAELESKRCCDAVWRAEGRGRAANERGNCCAMPGRHLCPLRAAHAALTRAVALRDKTTARLMMKVCTHGRGTRTRWIYQAGAGVTGVCVWGAVLQDPARCHSSVVP